MHACVHKKKVVSGRTLCTHLVAWHDRWGHTNNHVLQTRTRNTQHAARNQRLHVNSGLWVNLPRSDLRCMTHIHKGRVMANDFT